MKTLNYTALLCLFIMSTSCKQESNPQDLIPQHNTFKLASEQLSEKRTINVWRPNGEITDIDSLPVMYMADGGIKEDFPHIANTLDKLIKEKKIPPVMLVGIENTERRRDLTGPTEMESDKKAAPVVGGAAKFRAFIKEELIPEIERRYCTKNQRTIIGESLSGLFVMETFFLAPEIFDNYIAFDPSLWWNNHALVQNAKQYLNQALDSTKRIWFTTSDATDINVHTNALAKMLQTVNNPNIQWQYAPEPKEKHNTIFRATKEKAIIWTLNATPSQTDTASLR
jgi:predicted alpha/beta superfamily hydrolase